MANSNFDAFRQKMGPYAERAAAALSFDENVILAQWANESGYGTSPRARNDNNYAGIKYSTNSKTAIKKADGFARYATIDGFVTDYIRVMKLSYYDGVRKASETPGTADDFQALGASPYDADHYNDGSGPGSKLAKLAGVFVGGDAGSPLTAAEKAEIERKAKAGIGLSNPTAAAQAYYESVIGKKYQVCPTCNRLL